MLAATCSSESRDPSGTRRVLVLCWETPSDRAVAGCHLPLFWRDEALLISQPELLGSAGDLMRGRGWISSFFSIFSTFRIGRVTCHSLFWQAHKCCPSRCQVFLLWCDSPLSQMMAQPRVTSLCCLSSGDRDHPLQQGPASLPGLGPGHLPKSLE